MLFYDALDSLNFIVARILSIDIEDFMIVGICGQQMCSANDVEFDLF